MNEEVEENEQEEVVPKKRGRKPKIQPVTSFDESEESVSSVSDFVEKVEKKAKRKKKETAKKKTVRVKKSKKGKTILEVINGWFGSKKKCKKVKGKKKKGFQIIISVRFI